MVAEPSVGSGEFERVWDGTPALPFDASVARGASVWFGLVFYGVPLVALVAGLHALLRVAGGVGLSFGIGAVVVVVSMAIVIGRGVTMAAEIGEDGIRVRNRWRSVRVGWDEIEEVELSVSGPWMLADLVEDTVEIFRSGGEHHEPVDARTHDLIALTRRGRRWRLKVYASSGITADARAMQEVTSAFAARGFRVKEPVSAEEASQPVPGSLPAPQGPSSPPSAPLPPPPTTSLAPPPPPTGSPAP